jgi:TRAP-type C4-dicarboxylate transport system permease small subunit
MYKRLCGFNNSLYGLLRLLTIFLIVSMSLMVFMQVVFRYVLMKPIAWSEELSTYFFSWLAYFGAAAVFKNDAHLAVSSGVEAIKNETVKRVVVFVTRFGVLVFLCIVLWMSSGQVSVIFANDQRLLNVEWMRLGIMFLQVPLSALCMILFGLEKLVLLVRPGAVAGKGGDA